MRRLWIPLLAIVVAAAAALGWSFTPEQLPVSGEALGALPDARPPAQMSLSALPTGAMHAKAAFAYRGGAFSEPRDFTMTAVLVRHPRGDLLLDTGYGRHVVAHRRTLPWLMRALSTWSAGAPAADQLRRGGYAGPLSAIVITHAHWDHVSGVPDFPGVPVWMNADERRFVDGGAAMGALMHSFGAKGVREYAWDGGPYLGFARSRDWYGDGSVVLVPAPGHTPGSIVAFVTLPSGARYAFVGDLVWQREGIEIPAERPWLSRAMVDADAAAVRAGISHLAAIHARFPGIAIVPAHDARAAGELPVFPDAAR